MFSPFNARKLLHMGSSLAISLVPIPMSFFTKMTAIVLICGIMLKTCLNVPTRLRKREDGLDVGILLYGASCLVVIMTNESFVGLYPMFFSDPLAAISGRIAKRRLGRTDDNKTLFGSFTFFVTSAVWAVSITNLMHLQTISVKAALAFLEALLLTLLERNSGLFDNGALALAGVAFVKSINTPHLFLVLACQGGFLFAFRHVKHHSRV